VGGGEGSVRGLVTKKVTGLPALDLNLEGGGAKSLKL
jgi:hypothetical protein